MPGLLVGKNVGGEDPVIARRLVIFASEDVDWQIPVPCSWRMPLFVPARLLGCPNVS